MKKGSPFHIIIDEINPGLICPILSIPIISAGFSIIFDMSLILKTQIVISVLTYRIGFFARLQSDHSLMQILPLNL